MDKNTAKDLAKALAVMCVRNTFLETLHAGKTAESRLGDYSDVKVVTPTREIRWTDLSRISDKEMQILMKEVVNKLYTALIRLDDEAFMAALLRSGARQTLRWDEPEIIPRFVVSE
jgi:hypothetical protein